MDGTLEPKRTLCGSVSALLSVEHFDSIADVDAEQWDGLNGDNALCSHGWLMTHEEFRSLNHRPGYFVARDHRGIAAVVPYHLHEPGGRLGGLDQLLFGRGAVVARSLGITVLPALVCGPAMGVHDPILIRPGVAPNEQAALYHAVIDTMETEARRRRASVCFRNVVDEVSPLGALLRSRALAAGSEMPTTCLDLRFDSFAAYLRELKRSHPATAKNIRREIKRGRNADVVIREVEDPAADESRLHGLLDAHYHRLNGLPLPWRPGFLGALRARLGDRVVVYAAWRGDEPVGVAVGARARDTLFLLMIGMDPAGIRDAYLYFNLGYNRPIADAIAAGVRRIYCGKLVYDVKIRRGFRVVPASVYVKGRSRTHDVALKAALFAQTKSVSRKVELPRSGSNARPS